MPSEPFSSSEVVGLFEFLAINITILTELFSDVIYFTASSYFVSFICEPFFKVLNALTVCLLPIVNKAPNTLQVFDEPDHRMSD